MEDLTQKLTYLEKRMSNGMNSPESSWEDAINASFGAERDGFGNHYVVCVVNEVCVTYLSVLFSESLMDVE